MRSKTDVNGNILLVANWESDVGYAWWLMENFWLTIADTLRNRNIESILIYPKITKIPADIVNSDILIIEHNFQDTSIKNLVKLRKIFYTYNIKYIYLTDSPAYSWVYLLLRFWGIDKIIIHDHTPGERTAPTSLKRIIKSTIQKTPHLTADHFIAVTDFVYKRFIETTCIPMEKCSCAPNGIVPIDLSNIDTNYAQNAFNIPNDRLIVITTGRATYYKGIDFFIDCANEIINKRGRQDIHFLYCGDGPDMMDFKNLVTKYSLEGNFTFAGKRNDVRNILPSCNIGFHTAIGEVGYSLSILEYMSAGLATIVPDNPSTSLATTEGITGITYKPKDIESAVAALLESEINSKSFGKCASLHIKDEKNIDNTNKTLRQIVNRIIP